MVFFLIMKVRNQIRRSSGRPGDGSCAHREGLGRDLTLIGKAWGQIWRSSRRPGDGSGAHRAGLGTNPALIGTVWGRIEKAGGTVPMSAGSVPKPSR